MSAITCPTHTHANIMKSVSQTIGQAYPPSGVDCESEMGEAYTESLGSTQSLKQRVQNGMPIFEAMKRILEYEKLLSEEYLIQLHTKVKLIVEEDTALRRILGDVAADEQRHQEVLKLALELVSESNAGKE